MTRFAVGGKWGSPGSPSAPAAFRSSRSRVDSAATPSPVAAFPKKCRRVRNFALSSMLVLRQGRIQIQDEAGQRRIGGQLAGVQLLITGRFALRQILLRGGSIGLEQVAIIVKTVDQDCRFLLARPARGGHCKAIP